MSRRIDLLAAADLAEGEMRMVWVDQTDPVLVVHVNGEFRAVQGTCSHEYFELDRGFLTAGTLTCALHLSRFDLSNGEPLDPPAEPSAGGLCGGGAGRAGHDRGPGRTAGDQRGGVTGRKTLVSRSASRR